SSSGEEVVKESALSESPEKSPPLASTENEGGRKRSKSFGERFGGRLKRLLSPRSSASKEEAAALKIMEEIGDQSKAVKTLREYELEYLFNQVIFQLNGEVVKYADIDFLNSQEIEKIKRWAKHFSLLFIMQEKILRLLKNPLRADRIASDINRNL